jgi:fructose-bisphosphate aldolase, class II
MHGSSSVPQELVEMINKYGGKLKQAWGVPVEEIQRGIKHGVRKVNVDTDNRLAMTAAIRNVFSETPEKFDPRDYLKPAREAMKKICVERMTAFGQAGWAPKIKPVSCQEFAGYYTRQRRPVAV